MWAADIRHPILVVDALRKMSRCESTQAADSRLLGTVRFPPCFELVCGKRSAYHVALYFVASQKPKDLHLCFGLDACRASASAVMPSFNSANKSHLCRFWFEIWSLRFRTAS